MLPLRGSEAEAQNACTRTAYDFTHFPPKSYYNIDAPSQSHHWPQRLGMAYGCSWIDP